MTDYVLKERLKELLADKKVIAAIFYTFNFDADFFENYILPLFLPEAPFGDNKIQNAILWRLYQSNLPPITVYCDFHAKGITAPQLAYQVKTIDLRKNAERKPCFHPKNSFILCDDYSLVVFAGSNNLTSGGWCSNLEVAADMVLKNGEFFPRELKDALRDFIISIRRLINDKNRQMKHDDPEELVINFLNQRKYTDDTTSVYYHSIGKPFLKWLKEVVDGNEQIVEAEIISPFYSPDTELLKEIKNHLALDKIKFSIPFENTLVVAMEEQCFRSYETEGAEWCRIRALSSDKAYRFNHSKVFRLRGKTKVFTIIGSVNFTKAAFGGFGDDGNIEAALFFEETAGSWEPFLESYAGDFSFSGTKSEEDLIHDRADAPDLRFVINWYKKTLSFENPNGKFNGKIVFECRRDVLLTGKNKDEISLDKGLEEILSDNPIVKVKASGSDSIFYFYPVQEGIEVKPLPAKLRISDQKLLELWSMLGQDKPKVKIADEIGKFIERITNEEGEIEDANIIHQSTMNLMASHLSGLINLENTLKLKQHGFPVAKLERVKCMERLKYYLYTDNIDTLVGYRKLLNQMKQEGRLLNGFHWLLLHIILEKFYNRASNAFNKLNDEALPEAHKPFVDDLKNEIVKIEATLKNKGISSEHFNWAKKLLK